MAMARNIHELRSFVGMCAYYRRFIANFFSILGPLHDLTKKNVRFIWTSKQEEAFSILKEKLIYQLVLVLPDLMKSFEIQCDACGHSLGVILLQEGHAIAYKSRRLNDHKKNLDIYEKELLAIMHALDTWKLCLLKTPFILCTNHQSLKYLLTKTKPSGK